MSETIRDVVIRITAKQVKAKFEAPDVRPTIGAVGAVEKKTDAFLKNIGQLSKRANDKWAKGIRDVAYAQEAQAKTASDAARKAEAEKVRFAIAEGKKLVAISKTSEEIAKQNQIHAEATAKIAEQNLKAGDSFKMAGMGALTMARGVAFLAAGSEEDMTKMIKAIAPIQGVMDLVGGGFDAVKGTIEGFRALTAVTVLQGTAAKAAAAAQALQAGSQVAVATTAGVAAGAVTSLTAAMMANPLTVALVAIGAVLAAGVAAWTYYGYAAERAADKATAALKKETSQIERATAAMNARAAAARAMSDIESSAFSKRLENAGSLDSTNELENTKSLDKKMEMLQKRKEQLAKPLPIDEQGISRQKAKLAKLEQELQKKLSKRDAIDKKILETGQVSKFSGARGDATKEVETAKQRLFTLQKAMASEEKQSAEALNRQAEQRREAEKGILKVTQQQVDEQRKKLDLQKANLETALSAARAAAGELRSAEEIVGRLSDRDFFIAKRIAAKKKAGTALSKGEIQFQRDKLSGIAAVDQSLKAGDAAKGRDRGANSFVSDLTGVDIGASADNTAEFAADVGVEATKANRALNSLQQQRDETATEQRDIIDRMINIEEREQKVIQQQQDKINKLERDLAIIEKGIEKNQ